MGRSNRQSRRGPKQDLNHNLNPAPVEESGTDNIGNVAEEPKVETKPAEQPAQQKRRDPIFDEFYGELRYGQQVVVLTLGLHGAKAATEKRIEMQHELVKYLKAQGRRVDRSIYRDLRLAEIATELQVGQRAVTMGKDGIVVESHEEFIQHLQIAVPSKLKGRRLTELFGELNELRDQVRDEERSRLTTQRRKEQLARQVKSETSEGGVDETGTGGGDSLAYSDPVSKPTTLGDAVGEELQATGTEG